MVKYPHIEFTSIDDESSLRMSLWRAKPVQKCYRIGREFQAHLKTLAQPEDGLGCSTFDAIIAAHVWRCWVKALDVTPLDYELRLTFSVKAQTTVLEMGFTAMQCASHVPRARCLSSLAGAVSKKRPDWSARLGYESMRSI